MVCWLEATVAMRIVLVDPSRTVQKFVTRLLSARGYDVVAFGDAQDALRHMKVDTNVDVLITSAELISMSGMELCWEVRLLANQRRPIYVIMMSSQRDRHSVAEALDSGADDYIGKPPVYEELYARLRAAERLASMQRELIRLATTDPLTGALNRRAFFEAGIEACERAETGSPLSLVMLDIDHFKRINDTYGHAVGDEVLIAVTRAIEAEGGRFGRIGGEEFAGLLEGHDLDEASAFAERVRARVAALVIETEKGPLTLTSSFGVSERELHESIDDVLRRADVALYDAKNSGRNCVGVADETLWVSDYTTDGRPLRTGARRRRTTNDLFESIEAPDTAPAE
jgi:diguanylate cyclase (GGDEF)-like protein